MRPATCCVLILVAAVLATALRVTRLEQRPMHTDEAVHAYKFGELLEHNAYRYDPFEYHGPTLNYFTLVPALLSGAATLTEVSEVTLRIVPAFFGVLLLLLLLPLRQSLGCTAIASAAVFTAVSPAMVFYGRYYIMEMLLICFTFGALVCGYRFFQTRRSIWAILCGVNLGLMHATKETCIIAYGALAAALATVALLRTRQGYPVTTQLRSLLITWRPIALLLASGLVTSILFFSSFGSNPRGVWDSIATYATYFSRAGAGEHSVHEHPWHYYLGLLLQYRFDDGPYFSEGLILLLALVGLGIAIAGKGVRGVNFSLLRFIAVYTVLMTVIYSIIRYKTPWCLLGFFHGMILLAGVGAASLLQLKPRLLRYICALHLLIGTGYLASQACAASFSYDSDSRNPYVYAHTGRDIFPMVDRVKEIIKADPDGDRTRIQIICPGGDYWPFPWYLRGLNVEYLTAVNTNAPPAPVILIHPSLEPDLMTLLYEIPPPGQRAMYMFLFYRDGIVEYRELRPQVELRGFVSKELWDRFERMQQETPPPGSDIPPPGDGSNSSSVQP